MDYVCDTREQTHTHIPAQTQHTDKNYIRKTHTHTHTILNQETAFKRAACASKETLSGVGHKVKVTRTFSQTASEKSVRHTHTYTHTHRKVTEQFSTDPAA